MAVSVSEGWEAFRQNVSTGNSFARGARRGSEAFGRRTKSCQIMFRRRLRLALAFFWLDCWFPFLLCILAKKMSAVVVVVRFGHFCWRCILALHFAVSWLAFLQFEVARVS